MERKCSAAFEGGGVRGIGHVGAAFAMERAGYRFFEVAGSSAGAIVAALLAADYRAAEIRREMETIDYVKFKQKDLLDRLGAPGRLMSVALNFGVYNADYFEGWMDELLARKGKRTFGELETWNGMNRLKVTASDLTDGRLLVLPDDLATLGLDWRSYSIARAVRMSMSIPIFYEPFHLMDGAGREHLVVDGGLLSNYPVWIVDDGKSAPPYPAFGFQFYNQEECTVGECPHAAENLVQYLKSIVSTLLDASDRQARAHSPGDAQRTVFIPVTVQTGGRQHPISATEFDITKAESDALFDNGAHAAACFLSTWNFDAWKGAYRQASPGGL